MKLFTHHGPGHYIGSRYFAFAETREQAEAEIRRRLDAAGLAKEPLNVEEIAIAAGVFHEDDGDY